MVPLACFLNTIVLADNNQIEWKLIVPLIIVLIVLLVFSAFFSSCETAYSSVSILRLKSLSDDKKPGARKALYLAERYDALLTTILVGNNLVNIGATTIAAFVFTKLITNPTLSSLLNTVIMTIIILIFGEITPKAAAKESSEKVALKFSGILFIVHKILWPLAFVFYKLQKAFMKKSNLDSTPQVTEQELETIIETMEDEGVIENNGAELMQNALNINDKTVYEIMTPRVDVVALDVDESVEDIKKIFFEYQYSRMPVYDRDKDNIIGILRERDFFTSYINTNGNNVNIRSIMDKPYFVSEATKVDDLIKDMQNMKKHFAVVCDEYGGTSGIVTLEDALEELVGEIYDESDDIPEQSFQMKQLSDYKYLVNPEMDLEDLFDELNLGDAPESKYRNVGGFVYELCEEPPYKGKVVTYHVTVDDDSDFENPIIKEIDLIFTIDRVAKRRIRSLILELRNTSEVEDEKE